jgi:hypothetical protein
MPDWQKLERDYQAGVLPPNVKAAYERKRGAGRGPSEQSPVLSPATAVAEPLTTSPATPQAEDESTLRQIGRGVITYAPPVAAAILTRGRSLAKQATAVGGAAGAGHLAGRAILSAPGTPEAEGDYRPALKEAARTAVETGAAMAAGNWLKPAPRTAGVFRKTGRGILRAGTAGAGAGAGSLAAEVVDPSPDPLGRAQDTAVMTAAFDAGFQSIGAGIKKGFGRSPWATPNDPKTQAAQTLLKEQRPLPTEVSHSRFAQAVGDIATESVAAGTRLERQHDTSKQILSSRIDDFLRDAKAPRDPVVQQAMEGVGWRAGLSGDARHLNQRQTTQAMYQAVEDLNRTAFHQSGRPLPLLPGVRTSAFTLRNTAPPQSPERLTLEALARTPMLPVAQADRARQVLTRWQQTGTLQGAAAQELDDLVAVLGKSIDDPLYIDMAPLRTQIRDLRLSMQGNIDPAIDRVLLQASQIAPYRLSLGDARLLREELMALSRSYEAGGMQRVPTALGQRPQPGQGRSGASRLQRNAQSLSRAVDTAVSQSMHGLDPAVETAWRQANAAYRVGINARALEKWFSDPAVVDAATGTYKGSAILRMLARRESREDLKAMADNYGPDFVPNLREYANALQLLQERDVAGSWRIGHQLLRTGVRLPLSVITAATVDPLVGAIMFLAPEALAVILQQRPLTKLLLYGLKAPEGSKEGWRALGQVAGVLQSQGVSVVPGGSTEQPTVSEAPPAVPPKSHVAAQTSQPQQVPPVTSTPSAVEPKPVSRRQEKAYTFYKEKLADPALTQAELNAFWKQQFGKGTDTHARDGFLRAYKERFKSEPQ